MSKRKARIKRAEVEKFIEENESVELWLEGLASETQRRYVRALIAYTKFSGMTPQELLDLKENGGTQAEKLLDKFVVKAGGMSEGQKRNAVTAIHSFYKNNYLDLASRSGYGKVRYVKVNDYKCPTQDELRELVRNTHIRDDAIVNVASSGGFRVGTLAKLVWGDFEELWAWDGKTPIYIYVNSARLKGMGYEGKVEQHTFLTAHAAQVLLRYAEWYRSRRELDDDSPLFISQRKLTGLSEVGIWKVLKSLGKKFSPHDLRRFTQTSLETARINPNWIKKMQGKKLRGEDNPYSQPKIEEMRKSFMLAERYVTLARPQSQIDATQQRKQSIRDMGALLFGDDKEKMFELDNLLKNAETEQDLDDITMKLPKAFEPEYEYDTADGEEELIERLNGGWEHFKDTENGTVIIRKKIE